MLPTAMLRGLGLDPEAVKKQMEEAMKAAEKMAACFEQIVDLLEKLDNRLEQVEKKIDQLQKDIQNSKTYTATDQIVYVPCQDPGSTGSPIPPKTYTTSQD